ncbi:hypothetical protein IJ096_02225 [Candidatus Saccharibacteria bacterium]|nr:hypothetical protein [Candidatus Saccharibacteria bacterium]
MNKNNKILVEWEAEEYVARDKNAGWYVGLIVVGLLLVAFSIWLRWYTFTALVVVAVIALLVYSLRPPRRIHYALDNEGLVEGERLFKYDDFKSFGVMRDGAHFAIVLIPRKRFSPAVTVYFPEVQGEKIVDVFGMRLPMEEVKLDFLDKIVKGLRI